MSRAILSPRAPRGTAGTRQARRRPRPRPGCRQRPPRRHRCCAEPRGPAWQLPGRRRRRRRRRCWLPRPPRRPRPWQLPSRRPAPCVVGAPCSYHIRTMCVVGAPCSSRMLARHSRSPHAAVSTGQPRTQCPRPLHAAPHQVRVVHGLSQPDEQVEDVRVVVEQHAAVHVCAELRLALGVQRLQ